MDTQAVPLTPTTRSVLYLYDVQTGYGHFENNHCYKQHRQQNEQKHVCLLILPQIKAPF